MIQIAVIDPAGETHRLQAQPGASLMQVVRAAGLPVRGGCNGSVARGTCHVVGVPHWAALPPPPTEDEEAVLDTLFNISATSRLGCQISLGPALDGLTVTLPDRAE